MKTILFTLEYPPFKGGVAEYYRGLVENWPKPDKISVLHNNAGQLEKKSGWPRWWPAIWVLRSEIKKLKSNERLHIIVGQILPLGIVVFILNLFRLKKNKIPFTVIIHGTDINYTFRFKRKRMLAKLILKQAKNIICNSRYTSKIVEKRFGKQFNNKLKVVNPGITPTVGHRLLAVDLEKKFNLKNKFILFSVGRLVKRKGVDMTIEAIVELVKKIPNIEYFFTGDGPDRQYLLDLIKMQKPKLQEKIHYLGKITDQEKWAWLRRADIFCLPARDINGDVEGFGIVYREDGLAGTPVIAGRGSGSEDAVEDYESGILVDGGSPDDIMEAVLEMHRKPSLRVQMGEEGTRRALKDFNWSEKVYQIYKIISK